MSDATERLVDACREFGGESLRDVWLFDQWTYERLYVREDVAARTDDLDPEGFIDNERYGYVTRDTYETLYHAEFTYTVRGFSEFEQFRTFLEDADHRIGLYAGFDRGDGGRDFSRLHGPVQEATSEFPIEEFTPGGME